MSPVSQDAKLHILCAELVCVCDTVHVHVHVHTVTQLQNHTHTHTHTRTHKLSVSSVFYLIEYNYYYSNCYISMVEELSPYKMPYIIIT